MKSIALVLIKIYQRFISPYKGFSCAYRMHTGSASCSTLGCRSIRFYGLWRGLLVLRHRLVRCRVAHQRYLERAKVIHKQAGYCDLPCDLPSIEIHDCHLGDVCNVLSNCPSGDCGDWRSRKDKNKDQWIRISPKVSRPTQPNEESELTVGAVQ